MGERFKLEALLKYRRLLEDKAREKLSESLEREGKLRQELIGAHQRLDALCAELAGKEEEGLLASDLVFYNAGIQYRRQVLAELTEKSEEQRKRVEEDREALVRASRDRRLLEKLKERREAEGRKRAQRLETALLDEIALRSGEGEL